MDRACFVEHNGHKIFQLDFTDCSPVLGMEIIAASEKQIRSQPPKSVVTLVIASGASFNHQMNMALKDLAAGNEPYVKASAIVGMTGMHSIILNAVAMLSKREFKLFDEVGPAKDYLVGALKA